MTTQEIKRKLAAILSADVKGYSRLTGQEERWEDKDWRPFQRIVSGLQVRKHGP